MPEDTPEKLDAVRDNAKHEDFRMKNLDVLRHFVRLAADPQLKPDKKPCLPLRKYEILARKINEIGCDIGAYYKSLNNSK